MNLNDFRFICVLKLVVIIIQVNRFHEKIKWPWGFLNGVEISHWWMFTFKLIWMFAVHLIWIFTLHLIWMIFRWYIVDIREVVLVNWWLGMNVIVTRIIRVFRQITHILSDFTWIWKLAVYGVKVEWIGSRLDWLLRLRSCWSL